MILMLTFSFGLLKLQYLASRKNPLLATNTEILGVDDTYSLDSEEFMMAFALHKFHGSILDFDARYVRWIVRSWVDRDGKRDELFWPLHKCNDKEMESFFKPESEETEKEVKRLLEGGNLFCLHPSFKNFTLQGSWLKTGDSTSYDVWLTTCAS